MKELEEIKARCDAASPPPWGAKYEKPCDQDFISHARTDIPRLVKALEHLLRDIPLFIEKDCLNIMRKRVEEILRGDDD